MVTIATIADASGSDEESIKSNDSEYEMDDGEEENEEEAVHDKVKVATKPFYFDDEPPLQRARSTQNTPPSPAPSRLSAS